MTDTNRAAWITWQIRALWQHITNLNTRVEALEQNATEDRDG